MKCNICSSDFVESLDYKSLNNFKSFVCPNQHGEIFFDNDKVSEYILSTIIDNKKVWIYDLFPRKPPGLSRWMNWFYFF